MSEKTSKARPEPRCKRETKKRYEAPDLRKREKLTEVTGSQVPVVS